VALNCSAVALNSSQLDGGGIANAGDLAMSQCQQPSVARKHLRSQTRVEMRLAQHVMQAEEVDVLPFPPIDEDLFGSSLVAENTTGVSGGGIWNQNSMTVDDTTIAANTAPVGTGGGIFNTSTRGAEGMDIRTSTLSDNFAKFAGGGLYNGFRGSVLMVNDTISGNFTNGTGGGIDDESGVEATTRLIHVTVVNNSAPAGNGGGLDASLDEPGDIEVASSIVALNLGGDCSSPAGITSEDYNYSSDASCGFTMSNDQPDAGDPLLGPLDDNGGPTDTHLPASDSPVVDAAETGTPDCQAGGETVERDQRGEIRPESFFGEEERCDIGSVELEFSDAPPPDDGGGTFNSFAAQTGPTYAVNTTDDHIDGGGCEDSSAETDCTLREAVIAANADGVDSTIDVPAGRYVLTLEGAGEDAALTGDLDVTDDVTITGEIDDDGLVVTTVDGDQLDRVFHVNPGGGSPPPVVHLNDLVIQNGVQTTGGGIRSNGDLRLDNTVVVFNRAACEGGGIYSENALTITNGAVVKNGVRGSECDNAGGGIYSTGPLGKVSLSNSAVDLNYAPFEGAGIYSDALGASPALDVDESDVSLNVLTRQVLETCEGGCEGGGAGIYNETTAELTNTDVIGNVTLGGVGGGIYNGGEVMGASLLMPEGDLVASNVAGSVGGGLYTSETTSADIGGATFAGNTATGGGAIYNAGDLLESADTTYLMNTALGRGGGGLWNVRGRATLEGDDVLFNRTTHSVVNNDLNNDVTLGGGGIQNDSNGIEVVEVPEEEHSGVVFTDGTIIGNTAPAALGGGVDNRGTIYVDGSLLAGNSASASDRAGGGAINCFVMFVDDTTVDGNLAGDGDAGGLLNMEVCQINRTLHITNSTVSGNASADDGGGVQNDIGTTDVLNSTFSGNFAATGTGGGLDEVSPDTTHLHNATIAFNSALLGGGVSKDGGGDVDALNTLVGLNFGGDCDVLLTSLGHNLDSDSSCFNGPTDVTHPATFLDPLLGPLANNGGPTDTHALLDGSPAIDKTPDDEECPETDQRHVTRPQGELCDIGAYEREAAEPSPSPSPSASPSPSPSPSQTQPPSGGGGGGPTSTDLAVTKTASPEPVASGGTITYTITVKNNGPITATGVNTVDNLPGGVTFVSSSASQGSCSGTATVTCDLGTLPNGATATVTIVVTVTANSGSVTNSVAVQGTQSDPNPDNNRAEAVSRIIGTSPSPSPTTTPPGAKCPGFEDDPRNQIVGTDADEELVGTAGPDIICGLGGNDTLRGLGDDDLLIGDSGPVNHRPRIFAAAATGNKDVLRGGFGKDTLFGNEGKDKLRGGAGDDELNGQLGRDNLGGNNDADTLRGGKGRDRGRGGPGPDILLGGRGRDHMAGNADADVVKGGRGNDVLFGKRGDDQVIGGKGTDTENGGIGKDSCLESDDAQTHCES
jgi:uncharacterized repeat protein (TIGR01451 family)/CSLREA domain-containing protein